MTALFGSWSNSGGIKSASTGPGDELKGAVDGLSGRFTVLLPVEPPGVNWALNGGLIAAVVIVAGLLIYFLVFRRSTLTKYFTKQ